MDNYKESFTEGKETGTTVMPGFFSPHCRYLANEWTEKLGKMMDENASEDELLMFKAEGRKLAAQVGDKRGSLLCGQVVGLIDDVPTVGWPLYKSCSYGKNGY